MGIISFLIKKTKTYKDLKEKFIALENKKMELINQQNVLKKERESLLDFFSKESTNYSFRFFHVDKDNCDRIIIISNPVFLELHAFCLYIYCYDVNGNLLADIFFRVCDNKENKSHYFYIVDISNYGNNINKGLGTILLTRLKSIAKSFNCTHIEGWISPVDYNHIDRLKNFYKKNGFELIENKKENQIDIKWKNESYSKYII